MYHTEFYAIVKWQAINQENTTLTTVPDGLQDTGHEYTFSHLAIFHRLIQMPGGVIAQTIYYD